MFRKILIGLLIICLVSLSIYGYIKAREIKECDSLTPIFNQEINNLSGDVRVGIGAQTWGKVKRVYAVVDGKPCGGDFYLYVGPNSRPTTTIKTQFFANGSHKIKIVSLNYYDKVICSQVRDVVFNNEISDVNMTEAYRIDKPFYFSASSSSKSTNYILEIVNRNEDSNNTTVFFGESFTGDIKADIPPETFEDDMQFYELVIKNSASGDVKFRKFFGRDWDFDEDDFKENSSAPSAK
jgi:hypothetical protein